MALFGHIPSGPIGGDRGDGGNRSTRRANARVAS